MLVVVIVVAVSVIVIGGPMADIVVVKLEQGLR